MNKFSVFTGIPESTKGLVRELRVRWMHEEMGLPYEEIRTAHPESKTDEYKTKQPFGQVPYFQSGDLCMFETGAILLHLAMKHDKLLPGDEENKSKALSWMFAALNSVEPYMFHYFLLRNDPDASEAIKNKAKKIADDKLSVVSRELGEKEFFAGEFSIADIIMTTVLKTSVFLGINEHRNLIRFVERLESRPAFQRALKEHVKLYSK